MRASRLLCVALLFSATAVYADSKNPADYPLRIHIFGRSETTFYHNRVEEEAKGDGRANLFEGGVAHGVDFSFACDEKLRASFGYETYMARWKKPGRELTVLLPIFGKKNTFFTCNLQTDVKDFAYASRDGRTTSESVDQFKAWMVKHDYDPEHGKNQPIKVSSGDSGPQGSPQPSAPPPPPSQNP
jgi:hypothetical protein